MKVFATRAAMAAASSRWSKNGESIGFVPTMGALHDGHASLIRRARRENRRVVVSVFVNPKQFGPNEDYGVYPRSFPADKALCRRFGADAVYHPGVAQVYPGGFSTAVDVGGASQPLEGRFRPGFFRGVATVVLKLFETVRPTRAYFGEKDYQQLTVIRRLARDLDLDVAVVGCPTVRDRDGLALSSRNRYLAGSERLAAPRIYKALALGRRLAGRRGTTASWLVAQVRRAILAGIPTAKIDYVSLADASTLRPALRLEGRLRLLAAVRVGSTRLIDNIPISC